MVETAASARPPTLEQRKQGALLGLFIGDALAMPVHWYYDIANIKKDYGGNIEGYVAPKEYQTGGYLNKCSTGYNKEDPDGDVVGTVINHGKKHLWKTAECHNYHIGLQAGENTLEAQLARHLVRTLSEEGGKFSYDKFLQEYVKFMTTPGSHTDTFASGFHRTFFGNYAKGKDPKECAEGDENATDSMDALTLPIPAIVAAAGTDRPSEALREIARSVISIERKAIHLNEYVDLYTDMLASVLSGQKTIREAALEAGEKLGYDPKASADEANAKAGSIDFSTYLGGDGTDPVVPCPIKKSFPAFLHFAYRYGEAGPKTALLASTNAGGENVARGSALGALFGAQYGVEGFPEELRALHKREEIEGEIAKLLKAAASQKTEL